ncbi:uncharacterized protein LOC111250209 [Varroa destructor]|uniref:Ankyrin repeat protein n=1 Tax=Varroa destructor TaxID=109461 RepID=A0A7M7K5V1_VARDE|nr:uncharacterized protein LOC111250209 [Varroa destructor]
MAEDEESLTAKRARGPESPEDKLLFDLANTKEPHNNCRVKEDQDAILEQLSHEPTCHHPWAQWGPSIERLSQTAQALLAKLEPDVRNRYLNERIRFCHLKTRGKALLGVATRTGDLAAVKFLIDEMGVDPHSPLPRHSFMMTAIYYAHAPIVEYFVSKLGLTPDAWTSWLAMHPFAGETAIRQVLDVLVAHGQSLRDATAQDMYYAVTLHWSTTDYLPVQAKILFESGVPYVNQQVSRCALRAAATRGYASCVELFLTGNLHTAEQAATALELLEVGLQRIQKIIPLQAEGLTYFRRAVEVRQQNGLERLPDMPDSRCFSRIEDVEMLEKDLREGRMLRFLSECYFLILANEVGPIMLEGTSTLYDDETWFFRYLNTFTEVIDMFGTIEPPHRNFLGSAFQVSLKRLVQQSQPNWLEILDIFGAMRCLEIGAARCDDFLKQLDIAKLREQIKRAPQVTPSLLLSYIADVMLMSPPFQELRELVGMLVDIGARLDFTLEDYIDAEELIWPIKGHEICDHDHEHDEFDDNLDLDIAEDEGLQLVEFRGVDELGRVIEANLMIEINGGALQNILPLLPQQEEDDYDDDLGNMAEADEANERGIGGDDNGEENDVANNAIIRGEGAVANVAAAIRRMQGIVDEQANEADEGEIVILLGPENNEADAAADRAEDEVAEAVEAIAAEEEVEAATNQELTTLMRLLCSQWSGEDLPILERAIMAACCDLDAGNHPIIQRSPRRVLRLECLAARQCTPETWNTLPKGLFVLAAKHRTKTKREIELV